MEDNFAWKSHVIIDSELFEQRFAQFEKIIEKSSSSYSSR